MDQKMPSTIKRKVESDKIFTQLLLNLLNIYSICSNTIGLFFETLPTRYLQHTTYVYKDM